MILAFDPENHAITVRSWLIAHNKSSEIMKSLPPTGFIFSDEVGFVAAAFVRMVEGSHYAILEGLIANPMAYGRRRYDALNKIVEAVILHCKSLKVPKIMCWSKDSATLKRSLKFGFEEVPDKMLVLDIKE